MDRSYTVDIPGEIDKIGPDAINVVAPCVELIVDRELTLAF